MSLSPRSACLAFAGLSATLMLAGCGEPPGAVQGPIPPRVAVLEDTSGVVLPDPTSSEYCQAAQQILASTELRGENTVFTDMPAYRRSKSAANPHLIYQVVTYEGAMPIVVSCKLKTSAHLRAVYGPEAAGTQHGCGELTRRAQSVAVARLEAAGEIEAARRAAAFVIDENEPVTTGTAYLADFELSYVGTDGAIHLSSPFLFQNYDSWITRFLPWQVQGQQYCHTATADYIVALALGEMAPGTLITTTEDAPVTPR
ncbi:MAG: hypothetical protein JJT85_10860 [Chromatiales bacterium]|nr:hypothetical protein [Chromatiales bacterium]